MARKNSDVMPDSVPGSVFERGWKKREGTGTHTGIWIGRRVWKDEKGKQLERSFTCASEQEAWNKLGAFHTELLRGTVKVAEQTLGQWMDECMTTVFQPKLRPATFSLYQGFAKNHLAGLRNVPLSRLTVDMVEGVWTGKMVNRMMANTDWMATWQEPMSRNTKISLRRFVINLLNHATRKDRVKENVALRTVIVDRDETETKTVRFLSDSEKKALFKNMEAGTFRNLFHLQLCTGLRIGEALGIRWSDIEGSRLHVRQQVQRNRQTRTLVVQGLKTKKSRRTIPLIKEIRDMLAGMDRSEEFVFTTGKGTLIEPRNAQRFFEVAARKAGLADVSTHTLRHTTASHLRKMGVSIEDIRDILGHTDIRTTMIYAEIDFAVMESAMSKMTGLETQTA